MNEGYLSILCADLSGAERLREGLAASEVAHALGRYEKRIAQAVEGFHGRLQRVSASRVLGYFDDAEEALQSAVEMPRRIVALPPLSGVSLGIRVGVCVGHAANEMRYFEGEADNVACRLTDRAEVGQVLVSVPKRARGFSWNERVASARPELALDCGKRRLDVFEIDWRHFVPERRRPPAAEAETSQLFVHSAGLTLELNAEHPQLTIGRLASCGLQLKSERCSRVHARIELRGNAFVLVDQSTNGTFVAPEGGGELPVYRRELVLLGNGRIGFGGSLATADTEYVDFRIGA